LAAAGAVIVIAARRAEKNLEAARAIEAFNIKTAALRLTSARKRVLARTPVNRWGEPQDFAGIAVFHASSASDFITGAAIPVDGGYSSQG
jgi:2-deoxy-D-gluconate 3-dehydrogenase